MDTDKLAAAETAAAEAVATEAEATAEVAANAAAVEGVAAAEAGAAVAHANAAAAGLDAAERMRNFEEGSREWQSRQETMMADLAGRVGAMQETFQISLTTIATELQSIRQQSPQPLPAEEVILPENAEDGREESRAEQAPRRKKRRFLR